MSEPGQLKTTTASGESLALAITESDRDDQRYEQAWQLSHLLFSIGCPTPVTDLASLCTHFQASPELVKLLCSIPNSPISLAGNGFYVTLSCRFLSACAAQAWSLRLSSYPITPQIRNFLDWNLTMPNSYVIGRLREIDEEEELQLSPLPKRIRRDSEEAHNPVMASNSRIINEQADNLLTVVNGSMVETLAALESRALMFRCNHEVPFLFHDVNSAKKLEQSTNGKEIVVQEPCACPQTRILDHDILDASSVDASHMYCIEETKQSTAGPVEAADFKQVEVADVSPLDIDGCNQLEIGDFGYPFKVTVGEIAEKQGIIEGDEEDKDDMNLCLKGKTGTYFLPSNEVAPSIPSESVLRSINMAPDSEDNASSNHNPPKKEDPDEVVFSAPAGEQPLKPSTTIGNETRSLDHKMQDLCKPFENKKAASVSPRMQQKKRIKGPQKPKQTQNSIRLKDKKDQSEQNTFPYFESYIIEEEEGSGGYGTVYRAKKKGEGTKVAIKCPHAEAQKQYVNNERRMLERFGGKNFIIKYEGCLKSGDSDCFILEHVEHDRPELLKREIDVFLLQRYGYCMFSALASLHKQGVVHRDVKPGNFLFSRKTNKGYLIDFNLAMDLHQKYLRTDKSKSVSNLNSNHAAPQYPDSELPTTSKKHHTLLKSKNNANSVTNKSPQTTLAPNSLKKAVGKIRAQNDLSRWDRFNSQGADGSGLTSVKEVAGTRNNPSGDKKREPLPCHGRKELILFLQETMSGSNHEVSRTPASMKKRIAALPREAHKELLYLTPMPLLSNSLPVAGAGLTSKGGVIQKKDGPCAGTKGFRAPEVCLRSLHQGPKIDVWSAGVTLLYLMIGRAPFTGDPEQNMKEIAKLRGSEELWEVAKLHNRESSFPQELYESRYLRRVDLREWCRLNTKRSDFLIAIPRALFDLVDKCLTVNPSQRISAEDALRHDFFSPVHNSLRERRLVMQEIANAAASRGR
ncbi:PREDICTED: uncharacterized protein LOC104807924 isoform X2 [Tarenaya hassleriana]|uniref:uncharacterized protein LOC104807924 isoform X2 n=1 Tax=Tarenaya hassleriana TaxID=28532 RepID=UPI00053C74B4|nr:PREDICTED: uncharacterized protein LOC104807924 isoform X2 [Tarenaya hassleriana]